jgi:hypothetical protein
MPFHFRTCIRLTIAKSEIFILPLNEPAFSSHLMITATARGADVDEEGRIEMALKYRCSQGMSRLSLDSRELGRIVDQFIRMNALTDLSTDEIQKLAWLAVGLFHSPKGFPTTALVGLNIAAAKRNLGIFINMYDREGGIEDPGMQRAAALWMLTQLRVPGVYEAVDPFEPFAAPAQQTAA